MMQFDPVWWYLAHTPWQHLKGFYEWCGKFVQFFEQSGQQFGAIPDELRIAPEIARRL